VIEKGGQIIASNRLARSPFEDVGGNALAAAALDRARARARQGESVVERVDLYGSPPRRLEITASPLPDRGLVAVLVDMTERQRLDAVRRDFIANVNHELRTPIGALAVLAEALVGERDLATVERLAGRIATEVDRARALIEDLLHFSRVEAEKQPPHEPVAVDEVVQLAVARVSSLAERKGVGIDVSESADPSNVDGDKEQLIVAVANLLDNAVKYSDPETTVRVATMTDCAEVAVSVTDEGIGIPARDLDRIFERFYRVGPARDRQTGGSGLGLAIVRHVATNHGGQVSVRSREGMGSTFTLRLPRSRGHQ